MLTPPFKRQMLPFECCEGDMPAQASEASESDDAHGQATGSVGRARLAELDPHLHCSIIGTCISTTELRKLMTRFCDTKGASDLEIHHTAVDLTTKGGEIAKLLHKALDRRHALTLRTFARAQDEAALAKAWSDASQQGEIPGAYWALLTHRQVTPELRQKAFGEVHMLSHLVGSANGASIRRLVVLERQNAELNERLEREQARKQEMQAERDELAARVQQLESADIVRRQQAALQGAANDVRLDDESVQALVARHAERRERAEQAAAASRDEAERLRAELERLRRHALSMSQELSAAEDQLREMATDASPTGSLSAGLNGRRILYVGGRPSSTPAIRDLVVRNGGDFLYHDGGLEVRKGLLASAVPKADLIVFPVDCVDHDSVMNLKRLGERHGIRFLALRSASVASFAAALSAELIGTDEPDDQPASRFCLKHG